MRDSPVYLAMASSSRILSAHRLIICYLRSIKLLICIFGAAYSSQARALITQIAMVLTLSRIVVILLEVLA